MELVTKNQNTAVSGFADVERQTVELDATLIAAMTSQQYVYKFYAALRELVTNAAEAHVLVGRETVPFEVNIDWTEEPYSGIFQKRASANCPVRVFIRDYGPGMSREFVENGYYVLGKSTKRKTAVVGGSFGLGAKAVFGLTTSVEVHSYQNGVKSSYLAVMDQGFIKVRHMTDVATEEPDGTEIRFDCVQDINWTAHCEDASGAVKGYEIAYSDAGAYRQHDVSLATFQVAIFAATVPVGHPGSTYRTRPKLVLNTCEIKFPEWECYWDVRETSEPASFGRVEKDVFKCRWISESTSMSIWQADSRRTDKGLTAREWLNALCGWLVPKKPMIFWHNAIYGISEALPLSEWLLESRRVDSASAVDSDWYASLPQGHKHAPNVPLPALMRSIDDIGDVNSKGMVIFVPSDWRFGVTPERQTLILTQEDRTRVASLVIEDLRKFCELRFEYLYSLMRDTALSLRGAEIPADGDIESFNDDRQIRDGMRKMYSAYNLLRKISDAEETVLHAQLLKEVPELKKKWTKSAIRSHLKIAASDVFTGEVVNDRCFASDRDGDRLPRAVVLAPNLESAKVFARNNLTDSVMLLAGPYDSWDTLTSLRYSLALSGTRFLLSEAVHKPKPVKPDAYRYRTHTYRARIHMNQREKGLESAEQLNAFIRLHKDDSSVIPVAYLELEGVTTVVSVRGEDGVRKYQPITEIAAVEKMSKFASEVKLIVLRKSDSQKAIKGLADLGILPLHQWFSVAIRDMQRRAGRYHRFRKLLKAQNAAKAPYAAMLFLTGTNDIRIWAKQLGCRVKDIQRLPWYKLVMLDLQQDVEIEGGTALRYREYDAVIAGNWPDDIKRPLQLAKSDSVAPSEYGVVTPVSRAITRLRRLRALIDKTTVGPATPDLCIALVRDAESMCIGHRLAEGFCPAQLKRTSDGQKLSSTAHARYLYALCRDQKAKGYRKFKRDITVASLENLVRLFITVAGNDDFDLTKVEDDLANFQ